jgi:hypothetical protein
VSLWSPLCGHGCYHAPPRNLAKARHAQVVRKTWRSPIERALRKADPLATFTWLHEIADSMAPDVRDAFLNAIQTIRHTASEQDLADALEAGDMERVMEVLGLGHTPGHGGHQEAIAERILRAITLGEVEEELHHTVEAAGHAALEHTLAPEVIQHPITGQMRMRFDMVNPHTVQAVNTQGFNLIREINDGTRNGIRAIVAHAMEFGGHPYEQARQIKSLIGLTERQAAAVTNFRRLLEAGDSDALTRELRDHRFDATLRSAFRESRQLTQDQINTMVQRYADRALTMRAETIARTETINAARLGTQAAWRQAGEKGLLQHNRIRQGWMVTPDDRLCDYCSQVPDMNPDGVPLGQPFQTPFGPVDGPTLHPNCRCVVYLISS